MLFLVKPGRTAQCLSASVAGIGASSGRATIPIRMSSLSSEESSELLVWAFYKVLGSVCD